MAFTLAKNLEGATKKAVKATIAKLSPHAWGFMPTQGMMGAHGIPDHIHCVPITITKEMVGRQIGLFVAIEAKSAAAAKEADGGVSDLQGIAIKAIRAAGGVAEVVYGPKAVATAATTKILKSLTSLRRPL